MLIEASLLPIKLVITSYVIPIYYGSGFGTITGTVSNYGSGSSKAKVTVPVSLRPTVTVPMVSVPVPLPVPQHCQQRKKWSSQICLLI